MKKDILVQVGGTRISLSAGGAFSMVSGYAGQVNTQMEDELRLALMTFVQLMMESEEEE